MALTKSTIAIKDGNGTLTTTNGVANDGTNNLPSVGILGADGSTFQPAMASAATAGFQSITDGTNKAAVKAANTAAAATDPAMVVSLSPNSPLAAGTANVGNVGLAPNTSGGCSSYHLGANGTAPTATVKASAGQLYGAQFSNTGTGAIYVKFYDAASNPTIGSGTVKKTFTIPGTTTSSQPTVVLWSQLNGITCTSGLAYTATGGQGDSDATAITANVLTIDFDYK